MMIILSCSRVQARRRVFRVTLVERFDFASGDETHRDIHEVEVKALLLVPRLFARYNPTDRVQHFDGGGVGWESKNSGHRRIQRRLYSN